MQAEIQGQRVRSEIAFRQPSDQLLDLARRYLEIVDSGEWEKSEAANAERTRLHDALIEAMQQEDFIGTPNRGQVRWLARYFVQTDYLKTHHITQHEGRTLMFWRVTSSPAYPKLEALPPFDEHEERAALPFYQPVWVKINSFFKTATSAEASPNKSV